MSSMTESEHDYLLHADEEERSAFAALVVSGSSTPVSQGEMGEDCNWTRKLSFDLNCTASLYEAICEEEDEDQLSLRELVLKRVYQRERMFKLREQVLTQRLLDVEARLATALLRKENIDPDLVKSKSSANKSSSNAVVVAAETTPRKALSARMENLNC